MKKLLSVILSVLFIFSASAVSAEETTETTVRTFNVRFWAYDPIRDLEYVLKEEWVPYGGAATAPTNPPKLDGWVFDHWHQDFSYVTKDLNIDAIYKEITPTPIPPTATPKPTAKPTTPTEPSSTTIPTTIATESTATTITETSVEPTPTIEPTETTVSETTASVPEPTKASDEAGESGKTDPESETEFDPTLWIWIGVIGAIAAGGIIVFFVLKRRKGSKGA